MFASVFYCTQLTVAAIPHNSWCARGRGDGALDRIVPIVVLGAPE